jgi:hypothetical protein
MILRANWINIVKALNTGKTDAEIEAMPNDALIDIINAHDTVTAEQLKASLHNALNDFEDCLTIQAIDNIYNKYPQLHNNSAFLKAYQICKDNFLNPKL